MKKFLLFILSFFLVAGIKAQVAPEKELNTRNQPIFCLAYSNDGQYIATGGESKEIIIYKNGTWEEIARLKGHKDTPISIAFSHDGKKIAAAGKDNKVTIWSLSSRQVILSLKGHKDIIMAVAFSNDDKFIASASLDKTIIYWNLSTGMVEKQLIGHKKEVLSLDISPNGDYLVSGSIDETIKIWNLKTGQIKMSIPAHKRTVRAVAYSPDGSLIASGGDDRMMHLWDAYSGEKLNTFFGHKQWIETVKFSPDGNYLLSGGHDKIILLTDLRSGKVAFQSTKQDNYIRAVAFNPKGDSFSSATLFSKDLLVWNARNLDITPIELASAQKASAKSGKVPKFEILAPNNGEIFSIPSAKINATITSESNLRSIELYLNGQLFAKKDRSDLMMETSSGSQTAFVETIILNEGDNTMQIKATNIVGEGLSETYTIKYSNAPIKLLTWLAPTQATTNSSLQYLDIKAMINPAGGNQTVEIFVNDIAQAVLPFPANGGLLNTKVGLSAGLNTIRIKVTTPGYSKDADLRVVNYTPATRPAITWILPKTDTLINISSARINAKIESQVPIDKVEVRVNGIVAFTKLGLTESVFELNEQIPINSGANTISIHALNKAGETISDIRNITYMLPEKTNISWIAPASSTEVFTASYELKACVQSKSTVTKIEVFNNSQLIVSEFNPPSNAVGECTIDFVKSISLNQGINQLKIVSENAGGKTESEIISLNYTLPILASINWISPVGSSIISAENSITIDACVQSKTPVSNISIVVNNLIISSIPNPVKSTEACAYQVNQVIGLSSGTNTIVIKATNSAGETQSTPISAEQKTSNPYRFALVIGNEDYSSFQSDLESESDVDFAINDAKGFKDMCINTLGISDENITYLENARYIEMKKALKKINGVLKVTQGKAELFVFYAGHGFPDEKTKEPYLVPVDGSGTDLEFSAVKLSEFYASFTEHPTKRVTVFIDACFSGGARNQGLVAARGVKIVPNEVSSEVKKNLVVYTASSGNETSLPYKEKEHGLFSYYVLKKFEDANGSLTYKDLSDYVKEQVGIKAFMVNSKEQTPQTNISPEVQSEWATWNFFE